MCTCVYEHLTSILGPGFLFFFYDYTCNLASVLYVHPYTVHTCTGVHVFHVHVHVHVCVYKYIHVHVQVHVCYN